MKNLVPRCHRGFAFLLLSFVVLIISSSGVSASVRRARRRSLREMSSEVHFELRSMARGSSNLDAAALVPRAAKRIHRILAEGSTDEVGPFDQDARSYAYEALRSGAESLSREVKLLEFETEGDHGRRVLLRGGRDYSFDMDERESELRQLRLDAGQVKFYLFLTLMVVMAVGNIVNGNSGDKPFLAGPQYVNGVRGSDFDPISPCNRIPKSDDKTFGYLPILAGLFEDDFGDFSDAIDWLLEDFLKLEETLEKAKDVDVDGNCIGEGETCSLTSECCAGDTSNKVASCNLDDDQKSRQCEKSANAGKDFVWEPFCLMWSEAEDSNGIDTLAFKPQDPWPPVEFVPGVPSLVPLCKPDTNGDGIAAKGCKGCDFHMGFPIGKVVIGPFPFKITAKFDGVALSWAKPGKLAFDPGYDPEIWDGFRNVLLPQIDGMNFWLSLNFEVIPLPVWEWGKMMCQTGSEGGEAVELAEGFFKLTLKMDLFVSIDSTDEDDGNELVGQIGKNVAGENEGQRHLRELEGNDPCVIITATADVSIPLLGTMKLGGIAGGYCTFPAEENGNRCTPSGAFLNINQEFEIEGGLGGILSSILDGSPGTVEPQKSGNSIGVFLNDGDFEAVVFRYEAPVFSMFGVTLSGTGRPIIHFQYVKGSEIERRRKSILRTKVEGGWIPNCGNLAAEDICDNSNDAHWAPFGDNPDTQICRNILINPENNGNKLMYYNRVLAAELKDPEKESDNFLIRPPDGARFQAPARYDFSNNPDANVVILYLGLRDFGNFVIRVKEISLSLIFSDEDEPAIDEDDRNVALDAYNNLSDEAKKIWRPPSGWHFPSIQDYLDYLPEDDITAEEIEEANQWNREIEGAINDGLRAYVRIFCKIAVLFFIDISLGLIMMNYADNKDPSKWRVAAQFESSVAGLLYSVSVTTVIDFDRRRHLHLEEQDYHRALATSGLQGADWDVSFSMGCVPDSFCDAVVEFFKDVGEAIWKGVQKIGEFFTQDIRKFAEDAIAIVGEWGKAFIGAIKDFAEGIKDLFLNGAVGDVLNSERVKAFNEDAKKAVQTWSDGKFTLDDITEAGKLILQGAQIAIDFLVAGVKDIVNAIGDFFRNAGQAIKKCFTGAKWDEARHSGWRSPNECDAQCKPEGSAEDVKENCWCMDEFRCKVKVPQKRACEKKKLSWAFWKGCKTKCGGWGDMPTKTVVSFFPLRWRYPRFEGRRFDEACREERMAKLAEAEAKHGKMTAAGQTVDSNFKSNFKGMSNFSPKLQRLRRLEGDSVAKINSVTFQGIQATSNGVYQDDVSAQGFYDGSQLKKDSTNITDGVQRELTVQKLDFSRYGNPGNGARHLQSEEILRQFQRSATDIYLEEQNFKDEAFMARQPIILAPTIELTDSIGTQSNPVELSCSGSLASAWSLKLNSAEPEVMRRRRTKEISNLGSFETVIEFPAEASVLQMILNHTIPITIAPGGSSDDDKDDVFGEARELLGTDGVGSFMDRNPAENTANMIAPVNPLDYEWSVDVITAEPLCDKLEWTFVVAATDRTGTSNKINLHAYIPYGETAVSDAPQEIQMRCDSSSIGVEDLEYDYELQNVTGYESFTPLLRTDNCPSPYVHLLQKEDIVTKSGTPCTSDYKTVDRIWNLDIHTDKSHMNCSIQTPSSATFPFVQTFTLGGLVDETGLPATPEFDLQPYTYYVQKGNSVVSSVSDFFVKNVPPTSECGLCDNNTIDSVFYDQTEFSCDDEGNKTVTVRVVNNIGIEVTKTSTATVVCQTISPTTNPTESPTPKPSRFGVVPPVVKPTDKPTKKPKRAKLTKKPTGDHRNKTPLPTPKPSRDDRKDPESSTKSAKSKSGKAKSGKSKPSKRAKSEPGGSSITHVVAPHRNRDHAVVPKTREEDLFD